jgi:hypothetical protein
MPHMRVIISVHGGSVQDVFCSDAKADVRLIDWDVEESDPDAPGIFEFTTTDGRRRQVFVGGLSANPLNDMAGTDVERALKSAEVPYGQT